MSNILIIKHGSLGDLIQANGAIKDIKNFHKNRKVFLLTAQQYAIFMSECPYLDGVIIDKRLPRWNLFYLKNLKRTKRKNFFLRGSFALFSLFSILFLIFSPPIAFGLLFGEGLKFSTFFIWIWILNLKFF